jgi:hypothetical protein
MNKSNRDQLGLNIKLNGKVNNHTTYNPMWVIKKIKTNPEFKLIYLNKYVHSHYQEE